MVGGGKLGPRPSQVEIVHKRALPVEIARDVLLVVEPDPRIRRREICLVEEVSENTRFVNKNLQVIVAIVQPERGDIECAARIDTNGRVAVPRETQEIV